MLQPQVTSTDQLTALIERKHACLVQLRDIGERQQTFIESGDVTNLLRILVSKDRLIAALQRLESELTPFRAEDPDHREWPSAEARDHCARNVALCRELLDFIVNQERASETLLVQRRQAVAERLNHVNAAARASGAYRMHSRGKATFGLAPPGERNGTTAASLIEPLGSAAGPSSGLDLSSDFR